MLKNNIFIIIALLIEAFLIITITHYIYVVDDFERLKNLLPYFNVIIVVLTLSVIVAIRKMQKNVEKTTEVNLLKIHLLQVEELLNNLNAQKHEHTRHIQTLQAMLHLNEFEEAKKYIDGLTEHYWGVHNNIIFAGHPALTALLNSKNEVAISKKIDFAFTVKCDLKDLSVEPWDLCSIIGNLVDNALETVVGSKKTRRVSLEIKCEEDNYVIYVYNTGAKLSAKEIDKIFAAGYSTKNSAGRGYGLFIVKQLVDKYGGRIEIVSEEKTVFIVYLPIVRRV